MAIKKIILENIKKEELNKMNIVLFHLTEPKIYSGRTIFNRKEAESTFYNTKDLVTEVFYKHTSLLIKPGIYDKR